MSGTWPSRCETLLHQSRLPDKVLIVFPRAFTWRAVGTSNALRGVVNTSALPRHDHVELVHCPRDDGPGTKLLCAEHHLRRAERNARRDGQQHPLPTRTSSAPRWLVLADDDRAYKPWALMEVERAILASADHTHDSYSTPSRCGSHMCARLTGNEAISAGLRASARRPN